MTNDDELEGIDVDAKSQPPYLGAPDRPIPWPGIEKWRSEYHRFEPSGRVIVLSEINVVANVTPPAVNPERPQRVMFMRFRLEPGTHELPVDVARSFCVVRDNVVVSGRAPVQTRPVEFPDARLAPCFLPAGESRQGRRRQRS